MELNKEAARMMDLSREAVEKMKQNTEVLERMKQSREALGVMVKKAAKDGKKAAVFTAAAVLAAAGAAAGTAAWLRQRQAAAPVPAKPKRGKIRIACVGDSITYGAGVHNPHRDSYPSMLQRLLGRKYQVINFGFNGRTAVSHGDCPYDREMMYAQSFQAKPADVICMLGTNDSKPYNWDASDYEKDYSRIIGKYINQVGADHVYVMTPPKAFVVKGASEVVYDIKDEYIREELPIIIRIANVTGIHVIDLYRFTEDHPEWMADGVHPNRKGNRAIAAYVRDHIV